MAFTTTTKTNGLPWAWTVLEIGGRWGGLCQLQGAQGPGEVEGRKDFWMAFATSTSSLSPTNFKRMFWNCEFPSRGRNWWRILLKRLVPVSALSRAKSTNDSSPVKALYWSKTGGSYANCCCKDMRATATEFEAEVRLSFLRWPWSSLTVTST